MFPLLVLVTLTAIVAGLVATREAFRSGASPEALITMLVAGIGCAALLGAASPIAIPAAVGALIGLGLGLNLERRRRAARPALTVVRDTRVTESAERSAA